jgi:hypothetical protein
MPEKPNEQMAFLAPKLKILKEAIEVNSILLDLLADIFGSELAEEMAEENEEEEVDDEDFAEAEVI